MRGATLAELLGVAGVLPAEIAGLTADSRAVEPGMIFAAFQGFYADGVTYVPDAIAAGATAILTRPGVVLDLPPDVAHIEHADPRRLYAEMAARLAGAQPEVIVGVTGTNGKTSTVEFLRQLWAADDKISASVGTLGVRSDHFTMPRGLTTPEPVTLHKALAGLAEKGVSHCAMETSSHGLDQRRLEAVQFKVGGFTHLTRDHLDYHRTEARYLYAKARLFADLLPDDGGAVVNIERNDAATDFILDLVRGRRLELMTVGGKGDINFIRRERSPDGQIIELSVAGRHVDFLLPLIGDYQAENVLTALGLFLLSGGNLDRAVAQLGRLAGVPGRLEWMGTTARGGAVYLDYAHTPDGFRSLLTTLRGYTDGKLSLVFGCGGDRDAGKRTQMGRIAHEMADRIYITDDNPRSEDPALIRREILAVTPGGYEIADRGEAILAAMNDLGDGDLLVITGKGHEEGQITGDGILPHSDPDTIASGLGAGGRSA